MEGGTVFAHGLFEGEGTQQIVRFQHRLHFFEFGAGAKILRHKGVPEGFCCGRVDVIVLLDEGFRYTARLPVNDGKVEEGSACAEVTEVDEIS